MNVGLKKYSPLLAALTLAACVTARPARGSPPCLAHTRVPISSSTTRASASNSRSSRLVVIKPVRWPMTKQRRTQWRGRYSEPHREPSSARSPATPDRAPLSARRQGCCLAVPRVAMPQPTPTSKHSSTMTAPTCSACMPGATKCLRRHAIERRSPTTGRHSRTTTRRRLPVRIITDLPPARVSTYRRTMGAA